MYFFNLKHLCGLFTISICVWFMWYVQRVYSYWKFYKIPFEKPIFPFGNLKVFFRDKTLAEHLSSYYRRYKNSGPLIGLFFFLEPMLLITDLNLIQNILIRDFQHSNIYDVSRDPLAANLFNLDYETWKPLRLKLASAFSEKNIKQMFTQMVDVTNKLIEQLQNSIKTNAQVEIEINDWMTRYTMDVTDACVLGLNCHTLNNSNEKLLHFGKRVCDRPNMTPYRNALINQFRSLIGFFGFRTHYKEVTEYFLEMVKRTVKYRESNNETHRDLMNILIKLKNSKTKIEQMTIEEVAAQAYVFFLGGFISTSSTLMYCLHELSMQNQRNIQDKARQEICSILEKHNGKLTQKALKEMHFIDQIIQGKLKRKSKIYIYYE